MYVNENFLYLLNIPEVSISYYIVFIVLNFPSQFI